MKDLEELRKEIFDFYGPVVESKKLLEELDELKEAVRDNHTKIHITEEIADVLICIKHKMQELEISIDEIYKMQYMKVIRELKRIENKKKLNKFTNEKIK